MNTMAMTSGSDRNLRTWLFNPFYYLAGEKALVVGLAAIVAAGLIGLSSRTIFDGLLDVHTNSQLMVAWWKYPVINLCNWLMMGVLLLIAGKVISPSRIRAIDVFGTQALARVPNLLMAAVTALPWFQRYQEILAAEAKKGHPNLIAGPMGLVYLAGILVIILATVWMVALMYRGFSVSCNVRGRRAIGLFIAAVIVGEIATKYLVDLVLRL